MPNEPDDDKRCRIMALEPGDHTLAIAWWLVEQPMPYAQNARKLSPLAVETVAKSLKEFGWRQPIVVDKKGVIVAGHTRLRSKATPISQPISSRRFWRPASPRAGWRSSPRRRTSWLSAAASPATPTTQRPGGFRRQAPRHPGRLRTRSPSGPHHRHAPSKSDLATVSTARALNLRAF
jgi:hypothetical protein